MKINPKELSKALTAIVAAAAIAVSQGLIDGTAAKWVAVVIAAAGAVGVFAVPNSPPAGMKLVKAEGPKPVPTAPPLPPEPPTSSTPPPVSPSPPAGAGGPHGGGQP